MMYSHMAEIYHGNQCHELYIQCGNYNNNNVKMYQQFPPGGTDGRSLLNIFIAYIGNLVI